MRFLKRYGGTVGLLVGLAMGTVGCDQFSPTTVNNPNLTDEDFLETPDAARTWLRGVERQYLQTLNTLIVNLELASDNYFNNYTTNNKVFDIPRIDYHDVDNRSMQTTIARLRATANFGLERALPADPTSTPREEAEFLFYRAMSSLLAGEIFIGLPTGDRAEIADEDAHLRAAIADLERARSLVSDPELSNSYTLAMARAYYRLGDRSAAVREAQALLASAPDFIREAAYDGVSGPSNSMQGLLTSSVNNFQPLPRLDFLDPKFPNRGPQIQSPLAAQKAEEARLILIEAALATGDVAEARAEMLRLLELVDSRPIELVDSQLQVRGRAGGQIIYPTGSNVRVAFEPGAPFRDEFVLSRQDGLIPVPVVSGTSVTQADVGAIQSHDEAMYTLYLLRQEIFLAEGRRSGDLGIRFPVSYAEVLTNPSADDGAWYTLARIPSFIPDNFGMNRFDYDEQAGTVTIHHDLNRAIVANYRTPDIAPFHD